MATKKTLYGGETKKAVDNFPISGETVPPSVIHWLGRIKGAAARANAASGNASSPTSAPMTGRRSLPMCATADTALWSPAPRRR